MDIYEFWIKCLEEEKFEEISSSLRNVNSHGLDLGYFFISEINELFKNNECSKEILDKAYEFYLNKLKQTSVDY